jgi:hypothetical protein
MKSFKLSLSVSQIYRVTFILKVYLRPFIPELAALEIQKPHFEMETRLIIFFIFPIIAKSTCPPKEYRKKLDFDTLLANGIRPDYSYNETAPSSYPDRLVSSPGCPE